MIHGASACAADRARLSEVEEEIQRLEDHLASLRDKRENIRARLYDYKYPVLTLPNEITGENFLHYLPPYPSIPSLVGPQSPTKLLGICRLWREIALHCPLLWSVIGVESIWSDIGVESMAHADVEAALAWLKRSRSSPLSLRVHKPVDRLLQALIAHRSRWQYVDFHVLNSHIPLLCGPAPLLEEMEVKCPERGGSYLSDSTLETMSLSNAPRLHSICLRDVGYGPTSLPWRQITDLSLLSTRFAQCAPVLKCSTNLLRCKLVLTSVHADPIDIELPRLEIFILEAMNSLDCTVDCLEHFTRLPSLRKLEMSGQILGEYEPPERVERFKSFTARSGCPLQRLRIISEDLADIIDTVAFCAAFPGIDMEFVNIDGSPWAWPRSGLYDNIDWKKETYWNHADLSSSEGSTDGSGDLEDSD
ncbi:hypothetical protein C8F01DRAFT_1098594 [Mycena amicta]|nr:hypothetical protein C8F01DRAFT_1098594 [Mycena amicta]